MIDILQKVIDSNEGKKIKIPNIPPHWELKKDNWTMSGWRSDEVSFNPLKIIDEVEKLEKELYNDLINNKNTCPRPIYMDNNDNIITLIGLTRSAKRDTGEASDSLTHNSLGTSGTAATEADQNLVAEVSGGTPTYARRSYVTSGQRVVINQTAKYGMLWDDTMIDVTPAVDIRESGIHWHVSDTEKMHARVTFTPFTFDPGDLFVIQINELQANA
jgi:hypothetical protein